MKPPWLRRLHVTAHQGHPVTNCPLCAKAAECDIGPEPATVIRPATASRELARYCDDHARMYLGWGDTFHRMDQ
jgi:hypothetical protein